MSAPTTVSLSSIDLAQARAKAKSMNGFWEGLGIGTNRIARSKSDEATHYDGILGELAVCRALNLDYDFGIMKNGDPGFDIALPQLRVQVKHTRVQKGRLILNPLHRNTADITVLVVGDEPELRIAGYATRRDCSMAPLDDFGYGPVPALCQDELRPFSHIKEVFV